MLRRLSITLGTVRRGTALPPLRDAPSNRLRRGRPLRTLVLRKWSADPRRLPVLIAISLRWEVGVIPRRMVHPSIGLAMAGRVPRLTRLPQSRWRPAQPLLRYPIALCHKALPLPCLFSLPSRRMPSNRRPSVSGRRRVHRLIHKQMRHHPRIRPRLASRTV